MSASLVSPEDVVNAALGRIGYRERVNNMFEGTEASVLSLDIYAQTRDELLRAGEFDFSVRDTALTLLKSAPLFDPSDPNSEVGYIPGITAWTTNYPALPWLYSYTYPADCLKVRAVRPPPMIVPDMDPRPHRWQVDNDGVLNVKVILSNVSGAVLTYVARITDPALWDADFTEVLIAALARRLAPALSKITQGGLETEKAEAADEMNTERGAADRQG